MRCRSPASFRSADLGACRRFSQNGTLMSFRFHNRQTMKLFGHAYLSDQFFNGSYLLRDQENGHIRAPR